MWHCISCSNKIFLTMPPRSTSPSGRSTTIYAKSSMTTSSKLWCMAQPPRYSPSARRSSRSTAMNASSLSPSTPSTSWPTSFTILKSKSHRLKPCCTWAHPNSATSKTMRSTTINCRTIPTAMPCSPSQTSPNSPTNKRPASVPPSRRITVMPWRQ